MKNRLFVILLTGLIHISGNASAKTYILVHGAWHGGWCWHKVVPILESKGDRVLAPDLPSHGADKTPANGVTLKDYVKKIVDIANAENGTVILVGHSMAGVVIAQAAEELGNKKVEKLVFLDAFMPQNGESVFAMVGKAAAQNKAAGKNETEPSLTESLMMSDDKSTSTVKADMVKTLFYHDCKDEDVNFAKARLSAQAMAVLGTPVVLSDAVYGSIPKVYILCTDARDLDKTSLTDNVPCQKVYKLASSHSPFFSMPDKLADLIHAL